MDPEDAKRLLEALTEAGWATREGWIYAPKATMWLNCSQPWHRDLLQFREQMMGRLESLRRQTGFDSAVADTQSLVDVLGRLSSAPC
jgi:hypothetical protein